MKEEIKQIPYMNLMGGTLAIIAGYFIGFEMIKENWFGWAFIGTSFIFTFVLIYGIYLIIKKTVGVFTPPSAALKSR